MNTELEDRLAESMRHTADGITLTGDVLGRATRRHRRRTATIRIGTALGVAGLAAGVALGGGAGKDGGVAPRQDAAASASLRLVNAATASDDLSYRVRVSNDDGLTFEGAFDPKTDTGILRSPRDDSVMTELLIDGTRYIGGEKPLQPLPPDKGRGETYGRYGVYPGKHDRMSIYGNADTTLGAASPDPAALFAVLKAANATITENPDGSLHFTYTEKVKLGDSKTAGDVVLDADGRIAKVTLSGTWQSTAKGRLDSGTFGSTLELYDYGVKVTVKKPKDVVKIS